MARLVVRQAPDGRPDRGRDMGRIHGLNGSTLLIGRAKEAGFSLNSSNVSKRHAELTFKRGSYFIQDLGSTQGTKLNGVPVSKDPANPMRLKSGDHIWLADTVIEFIEESTAPVTTVIPSSPPPKLVTPVRSTPSAPEPHAPMKGVTISSVPSIAEAQKVPEPTIKIVPSAPVVAPIKPPLPPQPPPPPPAPAELQRQRSESGRAAPVADASARGLQPIYLLLDGSGSMAGESIAAVKAGIAELAKQIKLNPALRESVELSIIFIGSIPTLLSGPFTQGTSSERELAAFKPSGLCALGGAIREAIRLCASRVERRRPPLFLIALDGVATDVFDDAVRALQNANAGLLVACSWGELGDVSMFSASAHKMLTQTVIDKLSCEILMRWLSEVIVTLAVDPLPVDRAKFPWPAYPVDARVVAKV